MVMDRLVSTPPARPRPSGAEWKVENVVATVIVPIGKDEKIDLNKIARKYPDFDYRPERFPGLIMHIPNPKSTILVFRNGKMVVVGMRDESEANSVTDEVVSLLKGANVGIAGKPTITIRNVVASGDLHMYVDLIEATMVMDNAMYEPEVFPGLVYHMTEPKATFLIFNSGRFVCIGAKTKEIVGDAVAELVKYLKELGITSSEEGDEDVAY